MPLSKRIQSALLFAHLILYTIRHHLTILRRALTASLAHFFTGTPKHPVDPSEVQNVVVVGAAFAGYFAARILATTLPRDGRWRVVVVEPNSHFNFTWVLPRFCVLEGHEHKAFIPYVPEFFGDKVPVGMVQWVRDRVVRVGRESVVLRGGAEVKYKYLIVATGSTVRNGLPSRPGGEGREEGMELMRGLQLRIKNAQSIVVAGGGAAGVELASDAKFVFPEKRVTLVHSRQAVMHRFGPGLQTGAMEALQKLGVDVVLGEKVVSEGAEGEGFVTLSSGRTIECDCFINCTGQKPASGLVADVAPGAFAPSGHIRVKPTMQIADDSLPNVYVCGEVAETDATNPNSRIAARQAEVAADNVVRAARGQTPCYKYKNRFGDGAIKLTLGLDRSMVHFWDGKAEMVWHGDETDPAMMCDEAWTNIQAEPFVDTGVFRGQLADPRDLGAGGKAVEEMV
ncbi:hypothetical protein B0T22DRAFT_411239 [Podospora appendiculata]|uniref:FAD/NAD(P)-binding domain-containing protein n=1 Tax=Podospora appendiculata TaxID=314037 RepID=A0AAE0X1Y0_9PEZI|nr:hypothetical protein B0T22DRAFT_411239 [Podospora appendiculata]